MTASTAKRSTARKATATEAPSPEMEGAASVADAVETQPEPTPEPAPEPTPEPDEPKADEPKADEPKADEPDEAPAPEHRMETYVVLGPKGERIQVVRNIDTGEASYEAL